MLKPPKVYFSAIVRAHIITTFVFAHRKRENRPKRQLQPFRKVHASLFRRQMDDKRMHNSRLLAGTVEDYVPESGRTELSRVLSVSRRRQGKKCHV